MAIKGRPVVGKKYTVRGVTGNHSYKDGDILVLNYDDDTDTPFFNNLTANNEHRCVSLEYLEELNSMDDLKPGMVLVHKNRTTVDECIVLGVYDGGKRVVTVDTGGVNRVESNSLELFERNYFVRGEEPTEEETTEVTLQQVADKMGVDVSKLRIKDNE
jgi:hypothetical protein